MAGPYDLWRNNYDVPGPQDPRRQDNIWATEAPRWEELLRGSDVTAIKTNPLVQALGSYLSKPSTGIGEVTRVSPIDGRPVPPEPGVLDKLPATVQEGIGGLGLLANFLAPGVKLPPVAPKPTGIRAYHGSPHDFDRFDISKIGTGEGAQAYGHGLYFAENEAVAKAYRDQLSATRNLNVEGKSFDALSPLAQQYAEMVAAGHNMGEARSRLVKMLERARSSPDPYGNNKLDIESAERGIAAIDEIGLGTKITKNPGRIYEVNINADPERFLDWDKPLSGQSEALRAALSNPAEMGLKPKTVITKNGQTYSGWVDDAGKVIGQFAKGDTPPAQIFPDNPNVTVQNLVKTYLTGENTKHLAKAGIPGIRYKDAMSRDAPGGGTSNYVVFDDKLIEILRKYGLLPPAAAAGAALMEQQEPPL